MKVTLRDALTVVGTVIVVGLLIWGLNIKRMVDQHNILVQALVDQIQLQNDSLKAAGGPAKEP